MAQHFMLSPPDFTACSPNLLVPWYLLTSLLYYQYHLTLERISDADYDLICHRLLTHWYDVTHTHRVCVDPASLQAGTGFDLMYPRRLYRTLSLRLLSWLFSRSNRENRIYGYPLFIDSRSLKPLNGSQTQLYS